MPVAKLIRKADTQEILDDIFLDKEVKELFELNNDFLTAKLGKEPSYVIRNLKDIFSSIKEIATPKLESRGFKTPSLYFLVSVFYKEDGANTNKDETYSMTLSLRARMKEKDNINIKRGVVYDENFSKNFEELVHDIYRLIIQRLVSEYNIDILNKTLLCGVHLFNDLNTEIESMDVPAMDKVHEDYEYGVNEFLENDLVVPSYAIGKTPILDIDKLNIVFGVRDLELIDDLEDSDLAKVSDFIYELSQYHINIKNSEKRKEDLKSELEQLRIEEKPKEAEEDEDSSIVDAFFGLEELFGNEEQEKVDRKPEIEEQLVEIEKSLGGLGFSINIAYMNVRDIVERLFSKLVSSENTIRFLTFYPKEIMELVVTKPTSIRTKRIAPILKDSFYFDEEYFDEYIDNGILFTYVDGVKVRSPLGAKLVPENAFRGRLIKKVEGVESSIGLDDFFMSSMAKIAKTVKQ